MNMENITKTKDWKKAGDAIYETPEGVRFTDGPLKKVCEYYGIPSTLLNVDKKFGTDTLGQVAVVHAPTIKYVLTEEGDVQVLDPRSVLMEEKEFTEALSIASELSGIEPKLATPNYAKFELPALDSDDFMGDIFKRSFSIERLPQGGVSLATNLLRLICTNGMTIPDSQYKSLIRSAKLDKTVVGAFWDAVNNFDVDGYFKALFFRDGVPVIASVADYFGMHDTLSRLTEDPDFADLLFPKDPIKDFYSDQNIDLSKMARTSLNRLPSGIAYYQCFNILTNGAKQAERNLENELKVADWCRPSRLNQIKASDLVFKGMPHFGMETIKSRMGDIA